MMSIYVEGNDMQASDNHETTIGGEVKIVILISIEKAKRALKIEKWCILLLAEAGYQSTPKSRKSNGHAADYDSRNPCCDCLGWSKRGNWV
jgi:hypothetical protein